MLKGIRIFIRVTFKSVMHKIMYSLEWSPEDVVEKFLKPLAMENMAKPFIENQINGAVLLALTEEHMKELACSVLGERILFLEYLAVLKRHKRDADRSKALWSASTPHWGRQDEHRSCAGFCFQVRTSAHVCRHRGLIAFCTFMFFALCGCAVCCLACMCIHAHTHARL